MDTQRAAMMAIDLMSYHGLMKDDPLGYNNSWHFEFNRRATAVGVCNYHRRTIYLSRPLTELNSEDEILDTILHEIAHAVTPNDRGHGRIWKLSAMAMGARPQTCAGGDLVTVQQPYQGTCQDCGVVVNRARRPKHTLLHFGRHGKCGHKANHGGLIWKHNGVEIGRTF